MTAAEALHPALQHHLVNSLGWRRLRASQEEAIAPILAGYHVLILAPTAGGKTEAALFPIVSRMLTEKWRGLSVLYVCPIKALLNNLQPRLERYLGYIGRTVGLWHGDVPEADRRKLRSEPPDILLTTPESIEAILISKRTDSAAFFGDLHAVIVDELHAFAGDDRGWHLLMLLERLSRLAEHSIQRLGLSATVGNAGDLLHWLTRGLPPGQKLIGTGATANIAADVQIDQVGSLENAAYVLSRLYRGEKRLVFADSRSKVEKLAVELRRHGTRTFVSHSSLSQEERRQAEAAFAGGNDCVIVATSTLELGLDVGDLDRVVQIDAPGTVAAFLQRMGRSGRREGTRRNCLFLTTTNEALLFAAGLVRLWLDGFVESIVPPSSPWHLAAQQIMALCLQEGSVVRRDCDKFVRSLPGLETLGAESFSEIVDFMCRQRVLQDDNGVISLGTAAERLFGRRHFSDLVTSFTAPMLMDVRYGRVELGQVDPVTLRTRSGERPVFSLAGHSWSVKHVDWPTRLCWVEPTSDTGSARWLGSARAAHFQLCQAVQRIIVEGLPERHLSRRGAEALNEVRESFAWCSPEATALVSSREGAASWWTFAGARANSFLAVGLSNGDWSVTASDNFAIRLRTRHPERLPGRLRQFPELAEISAPIPNGLVSELKFNECLPNHIAERIISDRQLDILGARQILSKAVHVISDMR